jgi:hypothetical protein
LPIYRLLGGAGFAWAASFDARGRGTLRLVAIDASALQGEPVATARPATPPTSSDAARADDLPAPARLDEPAVTPASDAEGTIARLQFELASARQEKAALERGRVEAEAAARLARTEAAIAREEVEQARSAANVASEEIDRLKQGVAAPSSSFAWSNTALIAVGAAAILMFGVWLGASARSRASSTRFASPKGAARSASSDADGSEAIVGTGDGLPAPSEQMASIDQDGLVRELGRRLGLEEPTTLVPAEEHTASLVAEEVTAPLPADPLPAGDPTPASQPEAAAPPIAAAIPSEAAITSEPVPPDAGARA